VVKLTFSKQLQCHKPHLPLTELRFTSILTRKSHFKDLFHSQSLNIILKKVNLIHRKWTKRYIITQKNTKQGWLPYMTSGLQMVPTYTHSPEAKMELMCNNAVIITVPCCCSNSSYRIHNNTTETCIEGSRSSSCTSATIVLHMSQLSDEF